MDSCFFLCFLCISYVLLIAVDPFAFFFLSCQTQERKNSSKSNKQKTKFFCWGESELFASAKMSDDESSNSTSTESTLTGEDEWDDLFEDENDRADSEIASAFGSPLSLLKISSASFKKK